MRSTRRRALSACLEIVVVCGLLGCGGRVDGGTNADVTAASPASDPLTPEPDTSIVEEGEWGTWQLLSVEDDSHKRIYDQPFLEVDLHPNGKAYFWTCISATIGQGLRCESPYRQMCHQGTFTVVGTTWRITLTSPNGSRTVGAGDVKDEPSGDIAIDGTGILPKRAHYRRVAAPSSDGCAP